MALTATWQRSCVEADASPESSAPFAAKLGAASAPKMKLQPRVALEDIGNRVGKPKVQVTAKQSMVEKDHRRQPTVTLASDPASEHTVAYRVLRTAVKEDVPPPAPEPRMEPFQFKPQPRALTYKIGCDTREDELCQAFSSVMLEDEDLDLEDNNDLNLYSSYANSIYKYLRHLEEKQPVKCKYLARYEINENMCAGPIDWLVQVHMKYKLQEETLYLTVAIIDPFLQDNAVPKTKLQLVGVTAMLLANKYEEINASSLGDLRYITGDSCSEVQICQMEKTILKALDFRLGFALPPHFLKRASKIAEVDSKQYVLAKHLMELSIIDYDMVHFPSSAVAAAAFCLSLKLLDGCKLLPSLEHYLFYTESDLIPVMQHMAKNVVLLNNGVVKQKAIGKKYAMRTYMKTSTMEQLHLSIVRELAEPLLKIL